MALDPFSYAADTSNMQAGGKSFFENVGDAFTAGTAGAVLSGVQSIANTCIDLSNKIFGTEAERFDTSETLHNVNENWGSYYDDHKAVIDMAGFVGTSLVPGMLAVKGLKLLQTGNVAGAFGRVLGYSTRMEAANLDSALGQMAAEGGTIFNRLNTAKAASIAWGVADNVLQTAAFETGVALTMKSSPILDKEDWGSIFHDGVTNALLGGAFGGALGALGTNKLWKDAGKLVEGAQRRVDTVADLGANSLGVGDRVMSMAEALVDLPAAAVDKSVILSHDRVGVRKTLDLSGLLDRTRQDTVVNQVQKIRGVLTNVVADDTTVGVPLANSIIAVVKQGVEDGVDKAQIHQKLGDYFYNLHSVEGIGNRPTDLTGELRFLNAQQGDASKGAIFAKEAMPDAATYRVIGDESQVAHAMLGKDAQTAAEAWKNGFDTAYDPQFKKVLVNPDSIVYQKIATDDLKYAPMFLNTRSLQTSFTTVPTMADVATRDAPFAVGFNGVKSGNASFSFTPGAAYKAPESSLEATARHAWADNLKIIRGTVDTRDISLMDALAAAPEKAAKDLQIYDAATGTTRAYSDAAFDMDGMLFKAKRQSVLTMLDQAGIDAANAATSDVRDIAYRANVSPQFILDSTSVKFDMQQMYKLDGWKQELTQYSERQNLVLRYDTVAQSNAKNNFVDGPTAYAQRVKEAMQRNSDAADSVLGQKVAALAPVLDARIAQNADSAGAGATAFGASNANYFDSLRASLQSMGGLVAQTATDRAGAAITKLQGPAAILMQNPKAVAEVAAAVTSGRLSAESVSLYRVAGDAVAGTKAKSLIVDLESYEKALRNGAPTFAKQVEISEPAADFLAAFQQGHNLRNDQFNVLAAAHGVTRDFNPNKLYLPPVDTQRLPYFAFVRQGDGTIFGTSEVAMVTAKDAADLQNKATAIMQSNPSLKVIYKSNSEEYHKALGDYQYGRTIQNPVIDSTLRKQGLLGDYMPNMTPEGVISDFVNYTQRQETQLVRDAFSTKYAQQFTELQDLSDRYTAAQTSVYSGAQKGTVQDPIGDYIRLGMNISKRGEFTLLHQANEFVDAIGTRAYRGIEKATLAARNGDMTWQEAEATMQKFGLGKHFGPDETAAFAAAQQGPDGNIIKTAFQKANMLLATGMLRLDTANSLLNVISTPILLSTEVSALRNSIKNDPVIFAKFNDMLSQTVPGGAISIPSATKLIYNAIASYSKPESAALLQRFKDIGTVKGPAALYHEIIQDLSLTPNLLPSKYAATVDAAIEKGARLTLSNQAEDFTRYVTSHAMMQITDPLVKAGKMSMQEQNAFMQIFTNRVQGNYIAAQRPIMFQGTIGSAIGLFQTYQFNLFQQLFRHIENRDVKTIATMGAMQSSVFGLNGLPLFDAINTHIVGSYSINEKHSDAYSYAVQAAGKDLGDWAMYGTASAFPLFYGKAPALYSRGDINPRNAFILPTSFADVPAVAAATKVIGSVIGMGKQLANGAGPVDTMLFGLEHNGISRPLAGLAQVLKGNATTSKGDLISASSDYLSIANAARLIGAKPLDESIALNSMFRSKTYQALDKQRIDDLGIVVKDKLRGNQELAPEDIIDLQARYAAMGGRIQGFTQAIRRWDRGANTSIVNQVMQHSRTPAGQRLNEVLGGDPLPDYNNTQGTSE